LRPDGSGPVARPAAARERSAAPLAVLLLAAALAAVHLAAPIASLPRLAARSYNEGWNAYHAEAVLGDRPLYPAADALFPNNYPPLSFALVALASGVVPDALRAGRLLSLLAFLAVAVGIGWLARRSTGSDRLGVFAGLGFAALMGAAFDEYVGMNDPQLMAHAFMLGGLLLVTGGRGPLRLACAALLMLLGGLVKHNVVVVPLAVTFWLLGRDRRAFGTWLAASAVLVAGALAALGAIFGASLFENVLGPRTTSLAIATKVSADWLRHLAAPLAVGLLAAQEAWRDPDGRLLALYAGFALAIGFAFTAGEGVSYNAYFDLLIALTLLGVFLLARLAALVPAGVRVFPLAALALALLADPLIRAPDALLGLPRRLEEGAHFEAATREDVEYVAAREGPALCEMLALCFWAGKPPSVDLFNAQQYFRAGRADEELLLRRVARGEFAVVQLFFLSQDRDDERVSGQLTRALRTHYVIDRIGANGVFLRPRRGPAAGGR
jgi:hypothetical protein